VNLSGAEIGGLAAYSSARRRTSILRVLKHVGGIHATLQPTVEAQPDHPAQPIAVPGEQLGQCGRITRAGTADQVVSFARCAHASGSPPPS
jgi:hypothetical protein